MYAIEIIAVVTSLNCITTIKLFPTLRVHEELVETQEEMVYLARRDLLYVFNII